MYKLLESVLNTIEQESSMSIETLAKRHYISSIHLKRIFKFAFSKSMGQYMRARKLAKSMEDLMDRDKRLIDIAYQYGFEFEQSYIRSFKQVFGITPGDFRKEGGILKITPPIKLQGNKLGTGIVFDPEVVMISDFNIIGKRYHFTSHMESEVKAPKVGKKFFDNEREFIPGKIHEDVYIGFGKSIKGDWGNAYYFPSVQVACDVATPEGYVLNKVAHALYIRFKYIGSHSFYEVNHQVAEEMYSQIDDFLKVQNQYEINMAYVFERIDTAQCGDNYCLMEWYAPIHKI